MPSAGTKAAWVEKMKKSHDLESMPMDELWSFYELVTAALVSNISAETAKLDQRLRQLGLGNGVHNIKEIRYARPLTRGFIRNIEIPRSRPKLGRAVERSRAGWPHSLSRENRLMISGSI
jgi:hypothetical protein